MKRHWYRRSARRCLRIGASIDLDTKEVDDSARALTGADCGAIATVDAFRAAR